MERARAHLLISGRVQGVCFRMYTEKEARQHGLTGWVRNLSSGQVEALFEGNRKSIEEMVTWCHKGPPGARVNNVSVEWEPYHGDCQDFHVL